MKVLAINGSPAMDKGATALILKPFLEGMEEEGAETEVLYTKKLNIKPCCGELICWSKTPGVCIYNDDMKDVLPKLADADVFVLATPVYVDGITGPVKNFLDRIVPMIEPFFEIRDDHCRHPLREGVKAGKFVLVSACGFWEMDNFDPMVVHMKAMCKNAGREYAGALLRPQGPGVKFMAEMNIVGKILFSVKDIFKAAKEAGRQLVRDGAMSPETLKVVSRDIMPRDEYMKRANDAFKKALDKL